MKNKNTEDKQRAGAAARHCSIKNSRANKSYQAGQCASQRSGCSTCTFTSIPTGLMLKSATGNSSNKIFYPPVMHDSQSEEEILSKAGDREPTLKSNEGTKTTASISISRDGLRPNTIVSPSLQHGHGDGSGVNAERYLYESWMRAKRLVREGKQFVLSESMRRLKRLPGVGTEVSLPGVSTEEYLSESWMRAKRLVRGGGGHHVDTDPCRKSNKVEKIVRREICPNNPVDRTSCKRIESRMCDSATHAKS